MRRIRGLVLIRTGDSYIVYTKKGEALGLVTGWIEESGRMSAPFFIRNFKDRVSCFGYLDSNGGTDDDDWNTLHDAVGVLNGDYWKECDAELEASKLEEEKK